MAIDVRKVVCDAFEEKAFENGIVTTQTLAEMFKEHHKKMDKLITTRLAAIQKAGGGLTAEATVNEDKIEEPEFAQGDFHGEPTIATTPAMYRTYTHSGHFWHTPPGFALLPRMKLDTGWKIWCLGIPCYQIIATDDETARVAPIRPFRDFKNKMLPNHFQRDYNLHWRPIFEIMDAFAGLHRLDDPANTLNDLFDRAMEYLKTRVEYVFQKRKENPIK
jgi:hypothetical protein